MITQIKTLNDVVDFAKYLVDIEKLALHPDDNFRSYISSRNRPYYSEKEAILRNKLMNDCFEVCSKNNVEIYEILLPIIQKPVFG